MWYKGDYYYNLKILKIAGELIVLRCAASDLIVVVKDHVNFVWYSSLKKKYGDIVGNAPWERMAMPTPEKIKNAPLP